MSYKDWSDEKRAEHRRKGREWKLKNKDKIREANRKWYIKNRKEKIEKSLKYYYEDKAYREELLAKINPATEWEIMPKPKKKKKPVNPHIGSEFEEYLASEGLYYLLKNR